MMEIIDAHHHLWDLESKNYPWLCDEGGWAPPELRQSYLLEDFVADGEGLSIAKSVHVQAEFDERRPVEETAWLQSIADRDDSGGFPHGIVAYADLSNPDVEATLEQHRAYPNVRGIRQILNWRESSPLAIASRNYLADDVWRRQFSLLRRHDLSFDLQLLHDQMPAAVEFLRAHPDTTIIVDHTGMPIERDEPSLESWQRGMQLLASRENVHVKISGLGMSAVGFDVDAIRPLVLQTIEWFGVERCLFASNFPVDRLGVGYRTLWETFDQLTQEMSVDERRALFHDNAARLYRV